MEEGSKPQTMQKLCVAFKDALEHNSHSHEEPSNPPLLAVGWGKPLEMESLLIAQCFGYHFLPVSAPCRNKVVGGHELSSDQGAEPRI